MSDLTACRRNSDSFITGNSDPDHAKPACTCGFFSLQSPQLPAIVGLVHRYPGSDHLACPSHWETSDVTKRRDKNADAAEFLALLYQLIERDPSKADERLAELRREISRLQKK